MLALLNDFLHAVASLLQSYGYIGLFAISFLAAFALPLPSSTTLTISGALAAQGSFDIVSVLLVAYAGNVSADLLGYTIARRYGMPILERVGLSSLLHSKAFRWLEGYIREFSESIIFVTRIMTEAGPAVNLLAGLSGVRFRTFFVYDMLGEACFVLLFGLSGYFLGDAWINNSDFLLKGSLVIVTLGLVGGIAQYALRTHLQSRSASAD